MDTITVVDTITVSDWGLELESVNDLYNLEIVKGVYVNLFCVTRLYYRLNQRSILREINVIVDTTVKSVTHK